MATCKDCLHYDVCAVKRKMNTIKEYINGKSVTTDFIESVEERCKHFSPKSQFYCELPCKVGDTAYADFSGKGYYYDECKVKHIEFNSDWTEPLFTLICYDKADYRTYWLSDFGKEWFLYPTERKKKKALKERKEK